jgi:hypothetical protein
MTPANSFLPLLFALKSTIHVLLSNFWATQREL